MNYENKQNELQIYNLLKDFGKQPSDIKSTKLNIFLKPQNRIFQKQRK